MMGPGPQVVRSGAAPRLPQLLYVWAAANQAPGNGVATHDVRLGVMGVLAWCWTALRDLMSPLRAAEERETCTSSDWAPATCEQAGRPSTEAGPVLTRLQALICPQLAASVRQTMI